MTAPGSAVMMVKGTARGKGDRRVIHQLERVKDGALYPYVMACGYATTGVQDVEPGAERCRKCWGAAE